MAALDDILVTPIAPKPIRLPGNQDVGVRGYDVSKIDTPKSYPGNPTARPTNLLRAGEKYPEVRRDVKVTDISEGNAGNEEQTEEKKRLSYVEMFEALNPQKPETAEERAKREKREKREAVLAAVGDGISALSNLFFTTQYAPNAYDPSKGMSAKARERWDKLRLEREANRRAYSDGYLRALAMDEAGEREDRNWRHTLERERIADERYEIKAAQDKAMADLNEQLRRHQITAAEHKAEQERIAAQFAEETEKLKQENLRAGVRQKDAAAGASKASASASYSRARYYDKGGAGGSKSGPTLQLEEDEPMRFGDDKDYDRAVMRLAPDYGVPTTTEVKTGKAVTTGSNRGTPIMKTVNRPVKDIAADIEREAAKRKKSKSDNNTMPGVAGGGSSNTMPGVK